MALADAVVEIAEEMQDRARKGKPVDAEELGEYAKTLRIAVKAAGGITGALQQPRQATPPDSQRAAEEVATALRQAESGASMVELVDLGVDASTFVEIDPKMPVGARMPIAGRVYIFKEDRRLHFSQEETDRFRAR